MIVYRLTNKLTGQKYIGQYSGKDFAPYWGSGLYIKRAIRKYGRANFEKEIICECHSRKELNETEMKYILEENTRVPNGYNISPGGEGGDGGWSNHTEEENQKRKALISEAMKQHWQDPVMRQNYLDKIDPEQRRADAKAMWSDPIKKKEIADKIRGQKRTEEQCRRIAEAQRGKKLSEEHKQKIGEWGKGRKHSEEEKQAISKALKGNIVRSDEWKQKQSEAHRGIPQSKESRRKKREASSGRIWLHKDGTSRMVKSKEVPSLLDDGWLLGRKDLGDLPLHSQSAVVFAN